MYRQRRAAKAGSEKPKPATAGNTQPESTSGDQLSPAVDDTQIAAVDVANGKTVKVPSLLGMSVRQVVEQAAVAGLNLQVLGRGLVRSQEPAAGAQVMPGAAVVVHCAR